MAKNVIKEIVGSPITLSIGEFRVKEPSLFIVLQILQDAPAVLKAVAETATSEDEDQNLKTLVGLLVNPTVLAAFNKLLTSILSANIEDVEQITPSDLLKVLVALKEQVDWEDMKATFFQVVPRESFSRMFPNLTKREETSIPQST